MEQRHGLVPEAPRKIRPVRAVAFLATPRKIGGAVASVVLFRDDVFDVKREQWVVVLVYPAIFTAIASPSANQASNGSIHQEFLARRSRAFACKIATKSANAM